ncbi:MAG: thioredoxin family protein, partial [Magnetococcales bacterium]|nr:thioredoxin family protein [Magnetococcales bacterium]
VVEKSAWPLALHLVVKLVLSQRLVAAIEGPCHLSVVFAAYKEHKRILKHAQHPYGENFLNRKITQLEWLFKDHPHCTWELIMVDVDRHASLAFKYNVRGVPTIIVFRDNKQIASKAGLTSKGDLKKLLKQAYKEIPGERFDEGSWFSW